MIAAARLAICMFVLSALAGCAMMRPPGALRPDESERIAAELREHVEILASDAYGGRQPGTEGERLTLRYLAENWQAAGLESGTNDPANPWFAPVELQLRQPVQQNAIFRKSGRTLPLDPAAIRLFSSGRRALLEDAPVVFVGHLGRTLEESELAGRVALMPWNQPAPTLQRDALLDHGAAAVIAIIDRPEDFAELAAQRSRGSYRLAGEADGAILDGIITREAADLLVGKDMLARLIDKADQPGFRPITLPLNATLEARSSSASVLTHNLIARLPGSRPEAGAVLLMAHWDHFGTCGDENAPDRFCNGAVDNASGLAVLSALASRLAREPRHERDIYFVATTAEEWGLLGARAFTRDPPIPLDRIVAAFNIDTIGVPGRGKEVALVGEGLAPIAAEAEAVINQAGRVVAARGYAQQFVQRQDGWALLQADVPALMVAGAFARPQQMEAFTHRSYHKANDEAAEIDLLGAADDVLLHLALVRHFASVSAHPVADQASQPDLSAPDPPVRDQSGEAG